MQRSKALSSVKAVVRSAKEPEVRNLVPTAPREGNDVIQLHERPGIATPAVCGDEYASTAVSFVNLAPYIGGHVACAVTRWLGSAWWSHSARLRRLHQRIGHSLIGGRRNRFGAAHGFVLPPFGDREARRFELRSRRVASEPRSDAKAPLLFLLHETCRHQLHQTRQVAIRQPMTGERPRPLD